MLRSCLLLFFLRCTCSLHSLGQPSLAMSTNTLDFGNVHYKAEGMTHCPVKQRRVVLYNRGTDTLIVNKVFSEDATNLPVLESSIIAPDDSTLLHISCAQLSYMPEGRFSKLITIISNSPEKENSIRCFGHLTPLDFSFDMSDTSLGCIQMHSSGKAYIRTFYLENRSDSTLIVDSIVHASGCRIMPSTYELPPQSRTKFQALIRPGLNEEQSSWHSKVFFQGMSYESVSLRLKKPQGGDRRKPCNDRRRHSRELSS